MNTQRPRDGARHFTPKAREAVANGDPFNWLHKGEFRRRSDERDLLAALLHEEGKGSATGHLTAGGAYAAAQLGFDIAGDVGKRARQEISELGWLADSGGCATREALHAALLGAGPLVSHEARRREDAVFSEDGC